MTTPRVADPDRSMTVMRGADSRPIDTVKIDYPASADFEKALVLGLRVMVRWLDQYPNQPDWRHLSYCEIYENIMNNLQLSSGGDADKDVLLALSVFTQAFGLFSFPSIPIPD